MSQINTYFTAGSIPPGTFVATLTGNAGGPVPPDGTNNINIFGSGAITVTGNAGTNTLTIIDTNPTGFTWSVIVADQTAVVQNGYFCEKAGTLHLALPISSNVGDIIEISNELTALGIQLTQIAGQQILIGNENTTAGVTGTLTSSQIGDTLKIVCKVPNFIWRVTSVIGNWSVV